MLKRKARLRKSTIKKLVECFVVDVSATQASKLSKVNRNTANHSKTYSNRKGTHVNGIENFWSFAKRRLAKFNGVSRKTFLLHLKECEFRYNHKHDILSF